MTRDSDGEAPFARRWSQRKRQARAAEGQEPEAAAGAAVPAEPEAGQALEDLPDDEVLRRLGLPDPDTLRAGADFAAFMARGVPERIRNRALRRLWVSNPVLANLDGLIDYAEDYSDAAKAVPGLRTAYRVGKGYADRLAEIARSGKEGKAAEPPGGGDREAAAAPEAPAVTERPDTEEETPGPDGSGPDEPAGAEGRPQAGMPGAAGPEPSGAPGGGKKRRRRMVFRVAEG